MSRAGIIAAGDGTRLAQSHPGLVKPLVPVAGRPLCHWVAEALQNAGARSVTMLVNSRGTAVTQSLRAAFPGIAWSFLQEDTRTSWESFRLVAREMSREPGGFLMSTVDALIPPAELARFVAAVADSKAAAALALTDFIDDEKPLWADLAENGRVARLGSDAREKKWATAGLYYLGATLAARLPEAGAYRALREYWTDLARRGAEILGVPLRKTVDVDRPEDVSEAEKFLKEIKSW